MVSRSYRSQSGTRVPNFDTPRHKGSQGEEKRPEAGQGSRRPTATGREAGGPAAGLGTDERNPRTGVSSSGHCNTSLIGEQ